MKFGVNCSFFGRCVSRAALAAGDLPQVPAATAVPLTKMIPSSLPATRFGVIDYPVDRPIIDFL